jgi:thiol-disulfide isomerase/thioredoxin
MSPMMPQTRRLAIAALAAVVLGASLAVVYLTVLNPVRPARQSSALAKLQPEPRPAPVPAVAFADAAGRLHMLAEFRGRYVLLNLWATWCAPCVRELPALARLQGQVPQGRLIVVPVNVGRGNAAATAAFLKAHKADALPVYLDTNTAFLRAFRAYGLPLSVLIDPKGREIARAFGAVRWDAGESVAYFKALPAHAAS